jgi:hypothetical protein
VYRNTGLEPAAVCLEYFGQHTKDIATLQGTGKDFAVFPFKKGNAVLLKKAASFRVRKSEECRFDKSALLRTAVVIQKIVHASAVSKITLSRTGKTQVHARSVIPFENNDLFTATSGGNAASESSGSGTDDEHGWF